MSVAALFVRSDSIYRSIKGVQVWDAARDAFNWPGGYPVVAHPPCGQWGRLRAMAKPDQRQRSAGPFAVDQVRMYGGVLEHPAGSRLFEHCGLPEPGAPPDGYGGWTLKILQSWFGHYAAKNTWLYIVGVPPERVIFNYGLAIETHVIGIPGRRKDGTRKPQRLPEVTKAQREITPLPLAIWLVTLARSAAR